ncbi:DNA adenine methylase [Mesorhizobium sp.]|uniref:DNA adenine methylase n=1 Tax=Mesorhizobium sp. TaxID=1871066 RepID=UPI0025D1ECB3|nr:DNA adenine methylase [Mesorhizobium sp.]
MTNDNTDDDRLMHFTPLRYPGGKGRLASYVKAILKANNLLDGEYVEPFAGGAGIALELLFHEYVSRVHINDLSRSVYAFWRCVLDKTDQLCRLVQDTPRTVEEWDKHKYVMKNQAAHDDLAVGFAFFFLNRTNRSGIQNGGVIGGRAQAGGWKIDARYNANELGARIQSIAKLRSRITLTNMDALQFISVRKNVLPSKTLIYCDPPYYEKGRELYYHFYKHVDHEAVAQAMASIESQRWIVSYDNVDPINQMYCNWRKVTYDIGYSAHTARQGSEVMFFSKGLIMPQLVGAIIEKGRTEIAA